jgi:hypothetical protein
MRRLPPLRLLLSVVSILLLGTAGFSTGAPAEPEGRRELGGLRATPNIPVRSIGHRHGTPDHPAAAPGRGRQRCDKDIDPTGQISGVVQVAAQDNAICTTADIDTYTSGTDTFVAQAGGDDAAFILIRVTVPAAPVRFGPVVWTGGGGKKTYTPDVKAFDQGGRNYVALSLERNSPRAFCGVVIVDVTDPVRPVTVTQIYKNDPADFWCDVHNSFVEDVSGEGRYVYLTADARDDMRVVDIQNVTALPNPCDIAAGCGVEIGRYTSPTASNNNYVHDVTVLDHGAGERRAYLAYWDTGVVILDAAGVTPGTSPTPIVGPNMIDPSGFLAHHAFASPDGNLVFTQDEFLSGNGDEPIQMWDVSVPASPTYVDGLALGSDVPANPAHNLEIDFVIDPDRLYVGWYKLGLQGWDFTSGGFVRPGTAPSRTAALYHQAQTEPTDDAYDGAWGVRLSTIGINTYIFQSDRRHGLIVDCVLPCSS